MLRSHFSASGVAKRAKAVLNFCISACRHNLPHTTTNCALQSAREKTKQVLVHVFLYWNIVLFVLALLVFVRYM